MKDIAAFIHSATTRLALSYLAIIMLMCIGFSIIFYNASSRALDRPLPPALLMMDEGDSDFRDNSGRGRRGSALVEEYVSEIRRVLAGRLIILNISALVVGGALSYYLARRTLKPIEQNMEAQAQFVSDASHELRTPLTALQTTNEVALRRDKLTAKDAKHIIAQNIEEVIKLRALTDGLLKLARHDITAIGSSAASMQDIVAEAMNRVVSIAQSKRIAVEDTVHDIKILGETDSLIGAVVILLDNAIKYSPEGSTIHLTSEKKGKFGYLHVRDEGPGIRPYDLRKIFDRFYRADQSRSKHVVNGHGIGLSIARKIMEQNHGEVTATSTVGKGSTFTLKLPLA